MEIKEIEECVGDGGRVSSVEATNEGGCSLELAAERDAPRKLRHGQKKTESLSFLSATQHHHQYSIATRPE